MLRYIWYNRQKQMVVRFCCSRVIHRQTDIKITDLTQLFNNQFIEGTFKRYIPSKGKPKSKILPRVCGKCEGYGFYDWVTKLTDGDTSPIYNMGEGVNRPLIVKNTNPIEYVFVIDVPIEEYTIQVMYPTAFIPSPVSYRCEQCCGTGLDIFDIDALKVVTLDTIDLIRPIKTFDIEETVLKKDNMRGIYKWLNQSKSKALNFIASLRI